MEFRNTFGDPAGTCTCSPVRQLCQGCDRAAVRQLESQTLRPLSAFQDCSSGSKSHPPLRGCLALPLNMESGLVLDGLLTLPCAQGLHDGCVQ